MRRIPLVSSRNWNREDFAQLIFFFFFGNDLSWYLFYINLLHFYTKVDYNRKEEEEEETQEKKKSVLNNKYRCTCFFWVKCTYCMRVLWKIKNFQVERAASAQGSLPPQWPLWISVTMSHAWCMVNACRDRIATSATVTPDIPATTAKLTMVDLVDTLNMRRLKRMWGERIHTRRAR